MSGLHSARIVMVSVDFAEIEAMQASGDRDAAGAILAREAGNLEAAGAEGVVLCTNTMHRVTDAIETAVEIPLLHLADATPERILAAGVRRIGLLGTRFTIEQAFYRDRLTAHGLDVLVPEPAERDAVHRIIYEELVLGDVRDSSRRAVAGITENLAARGTVGVIEGFTETTMLNLADLVRVPRFDTTRIHAAAAVDWSLTSDMTP